MRLPPRFRRRWQQVPAVDDIRLPGNQKSLLDKQVRNDSARSLFGLRPMDEQDSVKQCKNCYWFMLLCDGKSCCCSASPLHENTVESQSCDHWRDKRYKSARISRIDPKGYEL